MSLAQAVAESLPRHGGKVLSRDGDAEFTAEQVLAGCRAAAGKLDAVAAGGRVGLLLPTGAACPAAVVGTLWSGRVAVPLNPTLKSNELDFLLRDAAIDTVVVTDATRPLVAGLDARAVPLAELLAFTGPSPEVPTPVDAEATAVMLYTSGTSGKPKGVPLTHANLLSNARALIDRAGLRGSDVFLGVLPVFHAFGLTGTITVPLLLGCEVTFLRFSPERAATAIAERKVTAFITVPSMFGLLARCKAPNAALASLTLPVCGGEALPQNVREGFRARFGRDLLEGYGLTETSPVVAVNLPGEHRPGTVGRPLPGVEVRVAGDDGRPQPAGGKGEVQVRGPNVMKGYHNRPDENAVTFSPDGWFRTGDEGVLDADGFLRITGRIKELIIRGGEKVMPREVEDVLCTCPGVQEAAVIGEPDGDRGEAVVAFVVPAGEPPAHEALRDHCRARLAEFKVPRRFTIARDLPRGATGKILKRALADWKPSP
jgi:long-chain acyl-CoA synthetase